MESAGDHNALTLFGMVVQTIIALGFLAGLFYLSRKSKTLRITLLLVIALLAALSIFVVVTYRDIGKGFAL